MRGTTASLPLVALLALALAGCGPTPPPGDSPLPPRPTWTSAPNGSPDATAAPTPLPTPTLAPGDLDPLADVTRILLQTETAYFCDDVACGVDGFRYDESPALAIAKLNEVFGIEPVVNRYEGGGRVDEDYAWGGFLLYFSTEGGALLGMAVQVTAASVEGIVIETEHGVRVGTPWAEAAASADSVHESVGETDDPIWEARFDEISTGTNETTSIIAFRGNRGTGPVGTLTGPIETGEYPG